jgi:hypothetical protein
MQAIRRIISAELLSPIISLPKEFQEGEVEIIVLSCSAKNEAVVSPIAPVQSDKGKTQKPILNASALKELQGAIANGLQNAVDRGENFGFDIQKFLDGTESKDNRAYRLLQEKNAWTNGVVDRAKKGKYGATAKMFAYGKQ